MPIVQLTRFRSDKSNDLVKAARGVKTIFKRHGAEYLQLARSHSGMREDEWLVATRYATGDVYRKVHEDLAREPGLRESEGDRAFAINTRTMRSGFRIVPQNSR
jgi:hypothetical protein